jgi:hypothetical protein
MTSSAKCSFFAKTNQDWDVKTLYALYDVGPQCSYVVRSGCLLKSLLIESERKDKNLQLRSFYYELEIQTPLFFTVALCTNLQVEYFQEQPSIMRH